MRGKTLSLNQLLFLTVFAFCDTFCVNRCLVQVDMHLSPRGAAMAFNYSIFMFIGWDGAVMASFHCVHFMPLTAPVLSAHLQLKSMIQKSICIQPRFKLRCFNDHIFFCLSVLQHL